MSETKRNTETGKWELDFRLGGRFGKRIQRKGRNGFENKDAAEMFQKRMEVEWADGQRFKTDKRYTVPQLGELYLKEHLEPKKLNPEGAWKALQPVLNAFTFDANKRPVIANRLEAKEIVHWMNRLLSTKTPRGTFVKASSANRYLTMLAAMYEFGKLMGYVDVNPCDKIKKLPEEEVEGRTLDADELSRVILSAPTLRVKEFMFLLFKTGVRPKHINNLQMEDVNLAEARFYVRNAKRKGHTVKVRMDAEVYAFFKQRFDSGRITGPVIDSTNQRREVVEAIRRSGVNNGRPYDERFTVYRLKHTFATEVLDRGIATDWQLGKLYGHKNGSMVSKHYAKVKESRSALIGDGVRWAEFTKETSAPDNRLPILPYSAN